MKPAPWFAGIVLGLCAATAATPAPEPPPALAQAQEVIEGRLKSLEAALAEAARSLARAGLEGPEARRALADLHKACPDVIDVCTVSPQGRMLLVEPAAYRAFEGKDISDQEQVRRVRDKRPALSRLFKAVEGMHALDFEYPVLSERQEFLGSVSVLFTPQAVFGPALAGVAKAGGWEPFILQTDGLILYDLDPAQVGRNTLKDEMFKPWPQVLALCRRVIAEEKGFGAYEFPAKETRRPARKEAHWTTLRAGGTTWRLVVSREAQ